MDGAAVRLSRLASLHDYLWAAVPILLVVSVWTYLSLAGGAAFDETRCRNGDVVAVHKDYVPVEHTCVFADGTEQRYVPLWANGLLYGTLAGAAVSFVVAWRLGRRLDRRATAAESPG